VTIAPSPSPPSGGGFNWKVALAGLALIGPLVLILASGFGRDPKLVSNALEGQRAPDFTLVTLDGEPVTLSSLRGPVVLNFWATWCEGCMVEHRDLLAAAERYEGRGVSFYGVLYQDEAPAARRYLKRSGSNYPTLVDETGRVSLDYGVAAVPETFVIRPDGTIAQKFTGSVTVGHLATVLEPLL
jgi:cytochrome c biogenesis protein CcmG/thiol:disulfide interchange protein DsbE